MFDTENLTQDGFVGFQSLRLMPGGCPQVPARPGVYVMLLDPPKTAFLAVSMGGHFKGRDPTVSPATLKAKWLEGVATLYVGRATNIRKRLQLLARYGRGEPVAHQGGRYLWQLADHHRFTVAWRLEDDPAAVESELLEEFEQAFGQLPFANLVRGSRPLAVA